MDSGLSVAVANTCLQMDARSAEAGGLASYYSSAFWEFTGTPKEGD